jgi:NAD-dependent dihydropyrimidine dehydrogenase PreA subunit
MPFAITDAGTDNKDLSCIEDRRADCIHEGARRLYVNPDECIDCGACEPIRPADGSYPDRRLPEDRHAFRAGNAGFLMVTRPGRDAPIGPPGGSHEIGPAAGDIAFTRSWTA